MIHNGRNEGEQANDGLRLLAVNEIVDLLIGQVRHLDYLTCPPCWPYNLIAGIAAAAERNVGAHELSWRRSASFREATIENELVVRYSYDHLPDAFDARVFKVLAGRTNTAANGDVSFLLRDIVDGLRLDPVNHQDYLRVSEAIKRLAGLLVTASSYIGDPNRRRPEHQNSQNWTAFSLMSSYDMPSDEDFLNSHVSVQWNQSVRAAIVAASTSTHESQESQA